MNITSAMAASFDWTSAGAGLDGTLRVPSGGGGTDYPLTIASKTDTRICLASGAVEFLAHVESAINTSIAASGRSVTLELRSDGRVSMTIDSGTFNYTPAGDLNTYLGLQGAGKVSTVVGDTQPPHMAYFASLSGGTWRPVVAGGVERTGGGKVVSIVATNTSWFRTLRARWVPSSQEIRTSTGVWTTPMRPSIASLSAIGDLSTGRDFSLIDFAHFARNSVVAFALTNFQALRGGSMSDSYYLGYLGPEAILNLSPERYDDQWPTWEECNLDFSLPTSNSSGTL